MDYALQEMDFWNREVAEFVSSICMHQPCIAGILQEVQFQQATRKTCKLVTSL